MISMSEDDAIHVDGDKYDELIGEKQPADEETTVLTDIEQEKEQSDNYKEIERRAQINDFVIEWAKTPTEHFSAVGPKLNLNVPKTNDYANEFMSVMRQSYEQGNYPKGVTDYFNHTSIPQKRRITHRMLDALAPTVDAILNNIEKPNNSEAFNNDVSYDQQQQPQQAPAIPLPPNPPGFNKIPQILDPDDLGDEQLVQSNHTITQLINFGLKKFAIEPAQQRRYLMDLIRTNKLFYATNRNALRDLLSSVVKHQPTVNSFLDWLESIAPIYLSPGEPFYRTMNGGMGLMDPNNPQQAMQGVNPMIQQLLGNLPPAQAQMVMQNMFANNRSSLQQQQAEEDAQMDRQVSRLYKVMTIKMLSQAMDPAASKPNPMMDMQQNYMMQGYRPSEVIQPDGTRRIEWLPPYAPQGGGQGGPFQDVQSIIGLVSSIISLTGAANKGTDLNETLTKVFMEKMMQDPVEQMMKLKQVSEQLGISRSGPAIDPVKQLELQMNLAKLSNEKEFGLRQLEIQEKQMQREEAREAAHEQQSNENIAMLMKFVPGVINNMAMPVIQKFFGGGNNQQQQAPPAPPMMGQEQQEYSGTMFAPQPPQPNYGKANRLVKTGQGTPVGGILNDNDYYVDPRNGPVMSSVEEQGELQRQAEMRRQIEDEVMHKINMSHLRNNMAPPFPQPAAQNEEFTKEQLMTLSNEQLAQIGQVISSQREKYESSIKDYNEVVQMRQQQQEQQPVMTTEEDSYPSLDHPPVVDPEEYRKRFNMPEGTDLESDGVISEEDYEAATASSGSVASQNEEEQQVVDFSDSPPQQGQGGQDSLLSDEDLSAEDVV